MKKLRNRKANKQAKKSEKKHKAVQDKTQQSIEKLRETVAMLDKREALMQQKIDKEIATAKAYMARGNKNMAVATLKRKKTYDAQLDKLLNQRLAVDQQLMALEGAAVTVESVRAMSQGSAALGSIQKTMDVDAVESTMENIRDQMDTADEIQQIMGSGVSNEVYDPDDMDDELAALMGEGQLDLPDIPKDAVSATSTSAFNEDDELAALERQMQVAG
eukprot:TRINITY_DN13151_c0_g1_i1.p1 TRINITY_DN13151_c0_g1~~TRINITY_DN13151_c0_g1_i1.p1  ORF type:complete len:218 (+),score=63.47 TRINITY_DN13151_c0_g1_i1:56-709(+)